MGGQADTCYIITKKINFKKTKMGMMRSMSNNKLRETQTKNWKKKRVQRAEKKRVKGIQVGAIEDPELMTEHHLSKRKTCQRANIALSGKKKRKIQKQIKRLQKDKAVMDTEPTPDAQSSSTKKIRKSVKDIEMDSDKVVSADVATVSSSVDIADVEMESMDT